MVPRLKTLPFAVVFAAHAFAQPGFLPVPAEQTAPSWPQFPRYLLEDQKTIWSAPFRSRQENAKLWAIFGGAAAGLVATDRWTSTRLPNTEDQMAVALWTSRIGAVYTLLPASAGIWAAGALTKNESVKKTGYLGVEAVANAAIVSTAMKAVTQRQRPLEGSGGGRFWKGAGRTWNAGSSFPSGHSMETWALASVVAHQHPRSKIIPVVAYGLAGTVSGSRLAARKHFASDIVIGSAVGWFIGEYVSRRHDPGKRPSKLRRALSHIHFGPPQ